MINIVKVIEGRVRPGNGKLSLQQVLSYGYSLPGRVIIKLISFVWNSEGCWCCLLAHLLQQVDYIFLNQTITVYVGESLSTDKKCSSVWDA